MIPEESMAKHLQAVCSLHAVAGLTAGHQVLDIVAAALALRDNMIDCHVLPLHILAAIRTMTVIPGINCLSLTLSHILLFIICYFYKVFLGISVFVCFLISIQAQNDNKDNMVDCEPNHPKDLLEYKIIE